MPDYKPEQCWASHLPSLFSCLLATNGPVLEVGAGDWSTPLLRQYCKTAERKFVSIEEDPVWAAKYGSFCHSGDELTAMLKAAAEQSKKIPFGWSVVFMDHNGHRRAKDALLFADAAEYIVVHDYPSPDIFKDFPTDRWKHQIVDRRARPWTLVLTQHDHLKERMWQ